MQTRIRYGAVVLTAVAVALAGWAVVRLLGIEPTVGKGATPDPVGAPDAALAALVAALAAWAAHAALVRYGARRWWPFVGSTALSVSMAGPGWLSDGASAVALIGLHFAVGAVLIAGFARAGRQPVRPCEDITADSISG